ncbi:hypothetical protein SCHPADRAFT_666917 [Schizopora paradoxa]|uniref:Uncharacterized protein n=1 Tax=Schizopora paradoxa TaxID=27342 RepID=A0A0H2R5I2_9AGAM|nr:hypothetical protein SCHPADRAFT_666917 [Schizopora paradoxa]
MSSARGRFLMAASLSVAYTFGRKLWLYSLVKGPLVLLQEQNRFDGSNSTWPLAAICKQSVSPEAAPTGRSEYQLKTKI